MDRTCSGSSRSLEGKLTVCCSRQGQTFIYKWAKERRREFGFSTWPLQHRWSGHVGELFLQERAAPSRSRAHRWLNYSPVASALKNYRLASVSPACSHHRTSQLHVHISLLPFGAVCSGKLKQSLAELLQVSAFVKTAQFFRRSVPPCLQPLLHQTVQTSCWSHLNPADLDTSIRSVYNVMSQTRSKFFKLLWNCLGTNSWLIDFLRVIS